MCDPMTFLAVTSAVVSMSGGQQQAQATSQAAEENLETQYEQTAVKQEQINEQATLEMHERQKQGMIDRAESRAIAGESGALGFSSDRLMADSFMQQGTDVMSIEQNRANQAKQGDVNNKSYRAQAQSTSNTAYNSAPGLLETGLQIAGSVAGSQARVNNATIN